jgi:hypothetical protein
MPAGFGLGRLHHEFSRGARERIIRGAIDAGFRHFDLAPAYGEGLAEKELGRVLGAQRGAVSITTKYGIPLHPIGELPTPLFLALRASDKFLPVKFGADYRRRDFSPRALAASLEASLRRLRTDYVDYLLVHEPVTLEEFRTLGDAWSEMERQQRLGKLRRFGVSGDTRLLLDAEKQGYVPDTAVRMVPMNDVTCSLPSSWFDGRDVFVFNIIKHMLRVRGDGATGRLDTRAVVEGFRRALPASRPIFATHDVAEMKRIGEAIAALPPSSTRSTPS